MEKIDGLHYLLIIFLSIFMVISAMLLYISLKISRKLIDERILAEDQLESMSNTMYQNNLNTLVKTGDLLKVANDVFAENKELVGLGSMLSLNTTSDMTEDDIVNAFCTPELLSPYIEVESNGHASLTIIRTSDIMNWFRNLSAINRAFLDMHKN